MPSFLKILAQRDCMNKDVLAKVEIKYLLAHRFFFCLFTVSISLVSINEMPELHLFVCQYRAEVLVHCKFFHGHILLLCVCVSLKERKKKKKKKKGTGTQS